MEVETAFSNLLTFIHNCSFFAAIIFPAVLAYLHHLIKYEEWDSTKYY